MKTIRAIALLTAIITAFMLTGCCHKDRLPEQISDLMKPDAENVVRLGLYGDPLDMNPIAHVITEHGPLMMNFVHAAPLRKLANGTYEPVLFDSYWLSRDDAGRVIMEAVWRQNLKWHDGTAFDPQDLEYTIDLMKNPDSKSPFAELARGISRISSFDRGQRTRIVFASNSRQFLDLLTVGLLPSHIIGDESLKTARVPVEGQASDTWPLYTDIPVGLGPYQVAARTKGSYALVEPVSDFYDGKQRPKVLIRTEYDLQNLISDFRSGKLDWINIPSIVASQIEDMKFDNVIPVRYANPATMLCAFNARRPQLADVRVRQAVDLLIDRRKIANQVPFEGEMLFANPFYDGEDMESNYDKRFARALELLDEAGWKDSDGDNIRDLNGEPLKISFAYNDDNLVRKTVLESIVPDLRRAGILIELDGVSWSELVSEKLETGDFDAVLMSYSLPVAGNWVSFLHSQPEPFTSINFSGLTDEQVDEAVTSLDSMFPGQNHDEAIAILSKYLESQKPVAFLFKPMDVALTKEAVKSEPEMAFWDDVLTWKILYGSEDSQL